MRVEVLVEPELEFGGAVRHLDVRYGLMQGGPLDVDSPSRRSISVGIVGTTETVEGVSLWLERCRSEIPAKPGPYPELFPRFPGFNLETTFRSSLQMETRLQRTVSQRAIDRLVKPLPSNAEIEEAAELFLDEMRYLSETSRPDVIACAPPFELMQSLKGDDQSAEEEPAEDDGSLKYDFHDLLKARAMGFHAPVQLVWPPTYDASKRRSQKGRTDKVQGVQDDATRAWNLHTAMYYKAGGTPWRLVRDATSCCVGISFYKSLDRQNLFTSMAQVFNERGDGVVVRGGQVKVSKRDRQPHLDAGDAEQLLRQALVIYRREHKNLPARIVVHKTSRYSDQELEGFHRAAEQAMVEETDFLSIGRSSVRLFRG